MCKVKLHLTGIAYETRPALQTRSRDLLLDPGLLAGYVQTSGIFHRRPPSSIPIVAETGSQNVYRKTHGPQMGRLTAVVLGTAVGFGSGIGGVRCVN